MSFHIAPNPSIHLNFELIGKIYGGKIRGRRVIRCTVLSKGIIDLIGLYGRVEVKSRR